MVFMHNVFCQVRAHRSMMLLQNKILSRSPSRYLPLPFSLPVLLLAEHITLPRRILRLPPRSLLSSAGGIDAATFSLRLCGISAETEGISLAREELVKPLVGCYCDAELLFQEHRPGKPPGASFGVGVGVQQSEQVIKYFNN